MRAPATPQRPVKHAFHISTFSHFHVLLKPSAWTWNYTLQHRSFFRMAPKSAMWDVFFIPAPYVPSSGCKTRLESRIKKRNPTCLYGGFSRPWRQHRERDFRLGLLLFRYYININIYLLPFIFIYLFIFFGGGVIFVLIFVLFLLYCFIYLFPLRFFLYKRFWSFLGVWFFSPVDRRETCVYPCVFAAAYTAVVLVLA